jgi:endonuclease/exonuclease/phosphatase family metal-dependent hydrolase
MADGRGTRAETRRTTWLLAAAVLPLSLAGAGARGDGAGEPLRVMSFNIRYDNPADGEDAWPHRREKVASMVRFHRADVVGLQEALLLQVEDLRSALPGFAWVGVSRSPGRDDEHCAVLYRRERFELVEQGTFWLSETPDERGSRGWDAALPRIVTWVRLRDLRGGAAFHLFNTHFDHRGEAARRESARLVLRRLVEVAGRGTPLVVVGDMNATPDSEPYRVLTATGGSDGPPLLRDAFFASQSPNHGPTSSWNGFRAIEPGRRIDYVLVSAGIEVLQHGILSDTFDGRFPSDHLPVLAEIAIPVSSGPR